MNKSTFLTTFFVVLSLTTYSQEPVFTGSYTVKEVVADLETEPVITNDDAADDICIYNNYQYPDDSLIIATDKKYGLVIYGLDGKIINHYPFGRVNNVDIINKYNINGESFPLVCGSNRTTNSIELYKLNTENNSLELILNKNNTSDLGDVYGITFYQNELDTYIFVSDKDSGKVEQWKLNQIENKLSIEKIRTIKFKTLIEGLVSDEYYNKLYIAEENKGLWQINADPNIPEERKMIFKVSKIFKKDFEGVALYKRNDGEGSIVLSVQGSNGYALIDRATLKLKSFVKIIDGAEIDGTSDTDGIEVSNLATSKYKKGILVVQDGFNDDGYQNFKIIDWNKISKQ